VEVLAYRVEFSEQGMRLARKIPLQL